MPAVPYGESKKKKKRKETKEIRIKTGEVKYPVSVNVRYVGLCTLRNLCKFWGIYKFVALCVV